MVYIGTNYIILKNEYDKIYRFVLNINKHLFKTTPETN